MAFAHFDKSAYGDGVDRTLRQDLVLAAVSSALLIIILHYVFRPTAAPATDAIVLPPPIGELTEQTREVRRRFDGMLVWNDILRGSTVYDGDSIYVPEGGAARVALKRGGQIIIDDKTLMVLRSMTGADAGDAIIDLLHGGAAGSAGDAKVAIRAGGAAVELARGSRAAVRLGSDKSVSVAVPVGAAAVTLKDGASLQINAHERRVVERGGVAVGAIEALGAELDKPAAGALLWIRTRGQDLSFTWHAVSGATGYAVELAHSGDFASLLTSARAKDTGLSIAILPAGTYYWRVRTFLPTGEQVSEARQLVLVEDVPPALLHPNAGETVDLSQTGALELTWVEVPGVHHYNIELSRPGMDWKATRQTTHPTDSIDATGGMFHEGNYCVRIRADEPERGDSPWSESTCFSLVTRGVLKAPRLYEPKRDAGPKKSRPHGERDDRRPGSRHATLWWLVGGTAAAAESPPQAASMVLRWEKIIGAVAYSVEFAEDEAFKTPVATVRAPDNYLRWTPPAARDYFWRVRAIDSEGREGELSETRRITLGAAPTVPPPPTTVPPPAAATPEVSERERTVAWDTATLAVPLRWHIAAGTAVDVEVARDKHFRRRLATLHSASGSASYTPSAGGVFYWRARQHEPAGAWSNVGSFRVALEPPAMQEVRVDAGTATAAWHAAYGATRYRVRLYSGVDEHAGGKPLRDSMATAHEDGAQAFESLAPGDYRVEVIALDAEGNASTPAKQVFRIAAASRVVSAQDVGLSVGAPSDGGENTAHTWSAGGRAAVYSNFGEVTTLRPGIEVGWRGILFEQNVGALATVGYYHATTNAKSADQTIAVQSSMHSFPIDVLAVYYVPTSIVTVSAAIGARAVGSLTYVSLPQAPGWTSSGWSFGGVLSCGAERGLGPGRAFADLAWGFSPRHVQGIVENDVGGLALTLGYRWFLL